jgi:2-dehydropantoate 2-reductase
MKISIIGTGGIGGFFGGKLAQAGNDVTFLARGEHLHAIKTNGLTVKSIHGNFHVDSVKATDRITNMSTPNLALICVKAWHVKEVARELIEIVNKNTIILPLQNGVLAAEELKEFFTADNVIGGLCMIFSKIESHGVINHFGAEPVIKFGELDNKITDRVLRIKDLFDKAGINSKISDDIQADLWKKFIAICVSGLLAVTKSTYGEIREVKETRRLMIELLTEIYELSQKIGINIHSDYVEKTVSFIDSFPHDSSSSLARDVWEGRPSEIEYQNGCVVKLAEKYGIETPVNRFIYSCILPMEKRARMKR